MNTSSQMVNWDHVLSVVSADCVNLLISEPFYLTQTCRIRVKVYSVNLVETLGKGSFGTVHPATDADKMKVAAKRTDGRNQMKMQKITRDLEKLHQLSHSNIAKVLDVYQEETLIWVMMEFCNMGDLNSHFQALHRKISDPELFGIMLDIAKGVEYLHNKNVIHRDIKPENILLNGGSPVVAKLTDFDLSKFLEEQYDTSVLTTDVDTKTYKAPEFWQRTADGKLNYHRNVDVYAMGLTFFGNGPGKEAIIPCD